MASNQKIHSGFTGTSRYSKGAEHESKSSAGVAGGTVPFEPEPIEALRARYEQAFVREWIAEEGMTDRPGMYREHLFDFEDGWRLLLSRDKLPGDQTIRHVSASYYGGNIIRMTADQIHETVIGKWRALSCKGLDWHLHLIGVTLGGVFHFYECDGHDQTNGEKERSH